MARRAAELVQDGSAVGLGTVVQAEEHLRELAGQRLYFSLTLRRGEAVPVRSAVATTSSASRAAVSVSAMSAA